jgi:hypothetical protein
LKKKENKAFAAQLCPYLMLNLLFHKFIFAQNLSTPLYPVPSSVSALHL